MKTKDHKIFYATWFKNILRQVWSKQDQKVYRCDVCMPHDFEVY